MPSSSPLTPLLDNANSNVVAQDAIGARAVEARGDVPAPMQGEEDDSPSPVERSPSLSVSEIAEPRRRRVGSQQSSHR